MRNLLLAILLAGVPQAPHVPMVPMAPGAHGGELATVHWRLVRDKSLENRVVERLAYNGTAYESANECAKEGAALPFPNAPLWPIGSIYIIACIPYHGDEDGNLQLLK